MKVITDNGQEFFIHDDGLKVYDKLPPHCYQIAKSPLRGWFLKKVDRPHSTETIYGNLYQKINKIENAYKPATRNFGVILAGDKGLGKTLTVKLLCERFADYPIILVNEYSKGIADFISSIKADCVVIFDEFDKTFKRYYDEDHETNNPQDEMLTLFDGLDGGHKLFVVTCNDIFSLDYYFLNRPGRFHYAMQMHYPNADDIRNYLGMKVKAEFNSEIDKVVNFAIRAPLNYDSLRAIAYELNTGIKFEEAVADLNIIAENRKNFTLVAEFSNGEIAKKNWIRDMYKSNSTRMFALENCGDIVCTVTLNTDNISFDGEKYNVNLNRATVKFKDDFKDWKVRELYFISDEQQKFHFTL